MLFTNNQIKQGVLQLVVGDWSLFADAMQKQAEQAIEPARELWRRRLLDFFEEFTSANRQWNEVANRPLELGMTTDIPALRNDYLHFTGGGLLVLCGVGHAILELPVLQDGGLSDEQKQYIRRLAELDWSRHAALWSGISSEPRARSHPHKGNVVLAVARAKSGLGLPVTEKEERAIAKATETAEALAARREQEPALFS